MSIKHLDVNANMEKSLDYANKAGKMGCDFLVFPEIFLTGPLSNVYLKYAMEIPNPIVDKFSNLANEYGMHIILGSIYEKSDEVIYNTSLIINDKGKIIGKYRKNYLWNGEKLFVKPSRDKPVFNTKYGKIGVNICWDLGFPEIPKTMALKGAKIIFTPSFWTTEDKYGWNLEEKDLSKVPKHNTETVFIDYVIPARAIENEVVYVFVNGYGEFEHLSGYKLELFGHTQIAIPFYGTIAKMDKGEGMLIEEIDLELLDLAEKVYQLREDTVRRTNLGIWDKI